MIFLIGYTIGLLNAIILILAFLYFKEPIISGSKIFETKVDRLKDRTGQKQGAIFFALSPADEARRKKIEQNRKMGRDTHISELM